MTGPNPDVWTILGKGKRQRSGPIKGRRRNAHEGFTAGHENRAGHRLYARVNQNRQFRKNVLGLGRWRRGRRLTAGYDTHAADTAIEPREPRWLRRLDVVAQDKQARKNGLRKGWRRP